MAKQLISSSETKSVYRDGNTAIKEFCEGFPKAEVLNEALCNARVESIDDQTGRNAKAHQAVPRRL